MAEPNARRFDSATQVDRLWIEDPGLLQLLEEAETLPEAREAVAAYLEDHEADVISGAFNLGRVERSVALDWTRCLREIFLEESEAIAGFSTLELLRRVARGQADDVSHGFVLEFVHALRAIHGRGGVEHGWLGGRSGVTTPDLEEFPHRGRRRAVARSQALDAMAGTMKEGVQSHPSGLEASVIGRRASHRRRILDLLGGTGDEDWFDPEWQFAHVLHGKEGFDVLREAAVLSSEETAAIHLAVRYGVPWGITPYYLSLFMLDTSDRAVDGQIRAQVIPPLHTVRAMIEHRENRGRAFDFMRERDTSPIDHVTRRYPSVAILKVCDVCPQVCVYCQRNWELGDAMETKRLPALEALEPALRWFETHPAIADVLLTGGDPLILSDNMLQALIERFVEMDHIRHIRIGTRVPVTMPMRVTEKLAGIIGRAVEPGRRWVSVVTHVESAYEVTPELAVAVDRLRTQRIRVYNQQVMTLEASLRFGPSATRMALVEAGIDPYYTFYTKGKDEHRQYLVPIARVLQERKEEARMLPGIFRTDEPVFNVPGLGKSHLRARQDRELIAIRGDGRRVYLFHPWEKGIAPVSPWPYVDVSIADYLERIAALGEDPSDYESIWYYL